MELNYNIFNIAVLFGALQGFALCFYCYPKRYINRKAFVMFFLFLFCLSFLNMIYAFLDLDLFKIYRPLHMFPLPYKWLIAPAFYFYVKNQFLKRNEISYHQREWWLFSPAILYFFLKFYWFVIAINENSYRIIQVTVDSNYFRYQEIVIILFNIILGISALKFLQQKRRNNQYGQTTEHSLTWLRKLILVFCGISIFALISCISDLIIHSGRESFPFVYPNLLLNAIFIYWIGFIGFTKPKYLFNKFSPVSTLIKTGISDKLEDAISNNIFTDPQLTLNKLAYRLNVSNKELSKFINDHYKMNFSEFMNHYRLKKVMELLASSEAQKYTLVGLAKKAGFNSKSSFNAVFKKSTGMTPSQYQKMLKE